MTIERDGYWADTGGSYPVGAVSAELEKLCACTKAALRKAMDAAKAGRPINVIGKGNPIVIT